MMDDSMLDRFARTFGSHLSRRRLSRLGAALTLLNTFTDGAVGKKKNSSNNNKKRPVTFCLDGQSVQASGKKKKKKLLKRGAIRGACVCTPQCDGASCGGSDGCGGTCGCSSNAVCDKGTCRACTVVCIGTGAECGAALQNALAAGGTVVACPGRYVGNYTTKVAFTLIGAGDGDDPAVSTILDAQGNGHVLEITNKLTITVSLNGVHITGGKIGLDLGAGIRMLGGGNLTIEGCSITNNAGLDLGGGIATNASVSIRNSRVVGNSSWGGGGMFLYGPIAEIHNTLIAGNSAFGVVGGIRSHMTAMTFVASTIDSNEAGDVGGGICNIDGTVIFDSASRVTTNAAKNGGGGIFSFGAGSIQQNGVLITGNSTPECSGNGC